MAQVVVELSADESKLLNSYRKIQAAQDKVDGKNKKLKQSHRGAFGRQAMGEMRSYVMGMVGIAASIATVQRGMMAVQQQADKMGDKQRQSKRGLAQLQQMVKSPEEMNRVVAESRKTLAEGGAANLDEAANLQFILESAGAPQYRASMSQMQKTGLVVDAEALVKATEQLKSAYGEASENFRDVINIGLGSNTGATASVDTLLAYAAKSGGFAAKLDIPQGDLMAATATISKTYAEEAGTYTRAFLASLLKEAIPKGKVTPGTLEEMVGQVKQLEDDGQSTFNILGGNIRGVAGYDALQAKFGIYKQLQEENRLAMSPNQYGKDAIARKVEFGKLVPEIVGATAIQMAEGNEELAFTVEGTMSNLARAVQKDLTTAGQRNFGGEGWLTANMESWFYRLIQGNQGFVTSTAQPRSQGGARDRLSDATLQSIEDAAKALRNAAESIEDATEKRRYEQAANALSE